MLTQKKAIEVLRKDFPYIKGNYRVKKLGLFGSFVKGAQRRGSDVDILVEFEQPIGLFEFIDLEAHLKHLLGTKIDLVSKKALKPYIGKHITKEVVYI